MAKLMKPWMLTTLFVMPMLLASPLLFAQEDEWNMGEWDEEEPKSYTVSGFVEASLSQRINNDTAIGSRTSLGDVRGQIQIDKTFEQSRVNLSADFYYDGVLNQSKAQLRELAWQGNLSWLGEWGNNIDAKLGQQVLTWGTGDYLFLNDMFAKDYQSFFSGRDDEYLKAPSLSAKFSGFYNWANIDFVVTPKFIPDIYINGDYFSFFSPIAERNMAPGFEVNSPEKPSSPEYALRVYKTVESTEYAFYAYNGFQKSPSATTETGLPYFSALNVYGASFRTPFAQGLLNAEFAYYDSKDDSDGNKPLIPNSQSRWLVAYEQELVKNLTGSAQFYVERTLDYKALTQASLAPQYEVAHNRVVLTQRLHYRALQQTLNVNLFNFYSTSDHDGYLKFSADYSPQDTWRLSGGMNIFYGEYAHTFYNQFQDASNVFVRFRYFY